MRRRRGRRSQALLAVIVMAALLPTGAACITDSNAGQGNRDGSVLGDGQVDLRPADTSAGSCSGTPSGCFCIAGGGGSLDTCSATSVVQTSGEMGICCDGDPLCACDANICRSDPARQLCQCGRTYMVNEAFRDAQGNVGGTVVAACPAPTGSQKCCLTAETNTCICEPLDCDGSRSVPTCSLGDVAVCLSGVQAVSACL